MDQYGLLLERVAAEPDRAITEFSLLTPAMRRVLPDPAEKLADDWRGPVHAWMTRIAVQHPDRIAVVDDRVAVSYRLLDRLSNRLSRKLIEHGLRPSDRVAVFAHRSASLTVAVYAILKAGGGFVMLDPAYPPARLIDFLEAAPVKRSDSHGGAGPMPVETEPILKDSGFQLVLPAKPLDFLARQSDSAAEIEVGPDHIAYIAFTSGSTGKPKGVMGRHGPLTHYTPWMKRTFAFGERDRFSMLSGLSHDPLQRDIFTPLSVGAALIVPDGDAISPGPFIALAGRETRNRRSPHALHGPTRRRGRAGRPALSSPRLLRRRGADQARSVASQGARPGCRLRQLLRLGPKPSGP